MGREAAINLSLIKQDPRRGSQVNASFRYELPQATREVTPVLHLRHPVEKGREVLLFSSADDPELFADDTSFAWSDSLRSRFRYAPESPRDGAVSTSPISLPSSIRELRIAVVTRGPDAESAITNITLATTFGGSAAWILAEKG